ncbi:MAG: N-6 DNA methylase [Candidatus Omnitrophica bacterium]|nr:N-6 DNA methylase [Candidatus Omnitrophota bacterium]
MTGTPKRNDTQAERLEPSVSKSKAASRTCTERKANGIHYTPPLLAGYLADQVVSALIGILPAEGKIRVLDPACGDGELLMAIVDAMPAANRGRLVLAGFDTDADAVRRAQGLLSRCRVSVVDIRCADFLSIVRASCNEAQLDLGFGDEVREGQGLEMGFDAVISNPPYVRTQVLGATAAQNLAARFGLTGRVDLYHAFVKAMTLGLREGGVLGLLTSNRFLSVQSGAAIRSWLAESFQLLRLVDLGDTKLFEAAVLPAIVLGMRKTGVERQDCEFIRVYEAGGEVQGSTRDVRSVLEVLDGAFSGYTRSGGVCFQVQTGRLQAPSGGDTPWSMSNGEIDSWLATVRRNSEGEFSNVGKVCVGIKTTADSVFIRNDWDSLPEGERPEEELLHPLVTHHLAERWNLPRNAGEAKRVLYPYDLRREERAPVNLEDYPRARAYLLNHAEQLRARTYVAAAGRQWFEIINGRLESGLRNSFLPGSLFMVSKTV